MIQPKWLSYYLFSFPFISFNQWTHEKEQLRRDAWKFINRSKHKACISNVPQSNGNSIEFFLSTQTWRVIKLSRLSHYTRTQYPLLEHCPPWTLLTLTLIYKSTLGWWSSRSLATSIHSQALGLRGLISQLGTEGGDAVPSSGTVIKARTCN